MHTWLHELQNLRTDYKGVKLHFLLKKYYHNNKYLVMHQGVEGVVRSGSIIK